MDLEVGHVNVSVKSKEQTEVELETIRQRKRLFEEDEGISGCPWEDDKPVVGWHTVQTCSSQLLDVLIC